VTRQGAETRIAIDARLDAALGTSDAARLDYQAGDDMGAFAGPHAVALGAAARVAEVLVVRPASTGALLLERYRVRDARLVAQATVALGATERVPPAVTALLAGRSIQVGEEASTGGMIAVRAEGRTTESNPSLLGPLTLGTFGLAGVTVAAIALLGAGCADSGPTGACLEERHTNSLAVAGYGGAGLLALGGALLWLLLNTDTEDTHIQRDPVPIALGPRGIAVRLP